MVSFGEKAKMKKAGNLNYGRSYVITTVRVIASDKDLHVLDFLYTQRKQISRALACVQKFC